MPRREFLLFILIAILSGCTMHQLATRNSSPALSTEVLALAEKYKSHTDDYPVLMGLQEGLRGKSLTKEEIVTLLGKPDNYENYGDIEYLYYGWYDLQVIVDHGLTKSVLLKATRPSSLPLSTEVLALAEKYKSRTADYRVLKGLQEGLHGRSLTKEEIVTLLGKPDNYENYGDVEYLYYGWYDLQVVIYHGRTKSVLLRAYY